MKKKTKSTNSGSTNYTMHDYFNLKRMQNSELQQKMKELHDKYDYTINDLMKKQNTKFKPYKQFSNWLILFAVYFVVILFVFGGYNLILAVVDLGLTIITMLLFSMFGIPCTKAYQNFIKKQLTKTINKKTKILTDFKDKQESVRQAAIDTYLKPAVANLKSTKYNGKMYVDSIVMDIRNAVESEIAGLDNAKHIEYLTLEFKFILQNNGIYYRDTYRSDYDFNFDKQRVPSCTNELEQVALADYIVNILKLELLKLHPDAKINHAHNIQEDYSCGIITIFYTEKNTNYMPIVDE